ncbi:sodium/calcium exchanger NCL1-like [Nicotiana tomentosiformis]|uniref:sodium/calcium exchanger NCL1-like n=1 Tax=Nicotiana tomentosiformis TaxID=4098 RepID=UPI00388C93E1
MMVAPTSSPFKGMQYFIKFRGESTRLFRKLDGDHNSYLTPSELEKLMENNKFREANLDHKTSVMEIMKDFDQDKDDMINENEFLSGLMWGEVDKLLDEAERERNKRFDYSLVLKWAFCKSVLQMILDIAILTLCADPIMDNIIRLASAVGILTFFIDNFVLTTLFFKLLQKQIYVGVILKNIMGMSTVLTVLYAKDLTWKYSAEVLIAMVVCDVTGLFTFITD